MAIYIDLDRLLKERGISSKEFAVMIQITEANLSILKTGKARAIRFSTLDEICRQLNCQPGDIIKYKD